MKYIVRFFYCNKQYHKNNKYHFWIYPKMYCGILGENEYRKIKSKKAFTCLTKIKSQKNLTKKVAFIANSAVATSNDIEEYNELDLLNYYIPNSEQLMALKNFKKIKFGIEE